jgi:uncharacterized membrane protein
MFECKSSNCIAGLEEMTKSIQFTPIIWNPSAWQGHVSDRLIELGFTVISSDIRQDMEYELDFIADVLDIKGTQHDIIVNPPYSRRIFEEYVNHLFTIIGTHKIALALIDRLKETTLEIAAKHNVCPIYTLEGKRTIWIVFEQIQNETKT